MSTTRVLAIIQAGGEGSRMDVLTRERAKPALPVAGVYQLVDFPLSSLSNSGITDVWLSVQYHGASLEEQVANGRPWDLDRTRGGLRLLMPEQGTGTADEDGFATGNADGLFRIRDQIAEHGPDVVVVMSADHVYRLDFAELVDDPPRAGRRVHGRHDRGGSGGGGGPRRHLGGRRPGRGDRLQARATRVRDGGGGDHRLPTRRA